MSFPGILVRSLRISRGRLSGQIGQTIHKGNIFFDTIPDFSYGHVLILAVGARGIPGAHLDCIASDSHPVGCGRGYESLHPEHGGAFH